MFCEYASGMCACLCAKVRKCVRASEMCARIRVCDLGICIVDHYRCWSKMDPTSLQTMFVFYKII